LVLRIERSFETSGSSIAAIKVGGFSEHIHIVVVERGSKDVAQSLAESLPLEGFIKGLVLHGSYLAVTGDEFYNLIID
jgi:hypothetical protein